MPAGTPSHSTQPRRQRPQVLPFSHWMTWIAVLTVVVSIHQLWDLMGVSGGVAAGGMVVVVPLGGLIARGFKGASEGVQKQRE